jgi:hypothetical protein
MPGGGGGATLRRMIPVALSLMLALAQDAPVPTARPDPVVVPAPAAPQPRQPGLRSLLDAPRTPAVAGKDDLRIGAPAESAQAPASDDRMRCRRTDNGFVCGSDEDGMRRTEDLLDDLFPK